MPFALFRDCFGRGRGNTKVEDASTRIRKKMTRSRGYAHVTAAQEIKLRNLEKVLKELECPICFNTCIPPIFTCVNGHILCNKCRKNVKMCPTCREGFSPTRNLFAENFIEQYSQGCQFAKDGCKFLRWKGDDMEPHESTCAYRMIQCIVPSCRLTLSYRSLLDHLKESHKIGGTTELPVMIHYVTQNETPIRDRKWLPYFIKAFGCTFYVMLQIARPHFWSWVWVQCPKAELTEQFNFMATLKFQSTKNISLEWRGPVFPIRINGASIIRDGLCYGGPDAVIQHFEHEGEINLFVNIERVPGRFSTDGSEGSDSGGGSRMMLHPSESEMLAIGDMERERNFSQLIIAASTQLIRRSSTSAAINQQQPTPRNPNRRTGSAKSKKSNPPSD